MPEAGRLHVILVRTRNPLNIGAVARAMSNFGFASLRLVNPYTEAFREARSAVGASEVLKSAKVFGSLAEAISDCSLVVGTTAGRHRELRQSLKTPPQAAPLLRRRLATQKVAVLFGSEKTGLSVDDLSHCHWSMRIPTTGSVNLGQAVAVCLYELVRDRKKVGIERVKRADSKRLERLHASLVDVLAASGYLKSGARGSGERKLRALLRRLQISPDDAELLQGMMRQIGWKIGGAGRNRTDA